MFSTKTTNSAKPRMDLAGEAEPREASSILGRQGTRQWLRCCCHCSVGRKANRGKGICMLQRQHNLFVHQIPQGRRGGKALLHLYSKPCWPQRGGIIKIQAPKASKASLLHSEAK